MIGGDNHRAAHLLQRLQHAAQPRIHRLAGRNCGSQIAGMADHIGVGVVHHDQVIARLYGLHELVRHLGRGHLWLQIIGRHFGR